MKLKRNCLLSFFVITLIFEKKVNSQPYIDLFSTRYVYSPERSVAGDGVTNSPLNYFNASLTLPIRFNKKQDALILSPFIERWETATDPGTVYEKYHYGIVLPVSLLLTWPPSKWEVLATPIIRMNDAVITSGSPLQFGGAVIGSYHKNKNLSYKFGAYVNGDFFGLFVMPLVGIDWRISEKDNLFGILPASLTFEHQLSRHFYTGGVFRTFTNSYHDSANNYFRVDENQLGIYLDTYISKHLVLNIETGHSVLRKIRTGPRYEVKNNWNIPDNFYFKLMLCYRLRFR